MPRAASSAPSAPVAPAPSIVVDASVANDGKEPSRRTREPSAEAAVLALPVEPTGETNLAAATDASGRIAIAREHVGSGPNPFDDQVWRAEGGSDGEVEVRVRPDSADAELAGAHPVIAGNPIREALGAFVKNKRNLAIAAGGVVVLILLIVLVAGGHSKPKHGGTQVAQKESPQETKPEPKPEPVQPVAGSDLTVAPGAGSAQAEAGSDATGDTAGSAETAEHPEAGKPDPARPAKPDGGEPGKKKAGAFGGKQVVLDYDTQAREAKPVAGATQDEQSAIAKARAAYAAGNSKLFSGDADGAIKAYRQALADYPAYVAGYRGLGLAYAQKGDNAKAVQALRTYVSTVPSAKDAAIIRKRIQMLGGK